MNYVQCTLSTGKVVEIRPIGWDEYWKIQKGNIFSMQQVEKDAKTMDNLEFTLAFLDVQRQSRENLLAPCVQDWDSISADLLMPEVVEIEEELKKISKMPVQLGNYVPAVEAAAAAGQNTAASA